MGACKTQQLLNKDPEFFYKIANVDDNEEANAKEKVKLVLKLTNVQSNDNYQIKLILYNDKRKTSSKIGGTTSLSNKDSGTNEVTFNNFFVMEYYFEKEQFISFQLFRDNTYLEDIQTTLGSIMGSRGQKYHEVFNITNITLNVQGHSLRNLGFVAYFNAECTGRFKGMGLSYLLTHVGSDVSLNTAKIYKSEVKEMVNKKNALASETLKFNEVKIPTIYFAPDGKMESNNLKIELYDSIHVRKLCEKQGNVQAMAGTYPLQLPGGNVFKYEMRIEKEYSFIDYLRGGMDINLTIGIDFTSSNKKPTDPTSLHYIGTQAMNAYEKAILSCGNIVAYYDYDQLFPVYGYGAKLPNQTEASMIFPINNNPQNPEINTINGVLQVYRQIVGQIEFFGPTKFAPIINAVIQECRNDKLNGKTQSYKILMILTDGLINDMDDTVDALVEASFLPISVIIIGIGRGDFGNMDILDADDNPLYDGDGRKADRDLVQFVPFHKFENDGDRLAQEVLEEVPRQVVEYFQHNHIPAGEPVLNIKKEQILGGN